MTAYPSAAGEIWKLWIKAGLPTLQVKEVFPNIILETPLFFSKQTQLSFLPFLHLTEHLINDVQPTLPELRIIEINIKRLQ